MKRLLAGVFACSFILNGPVRAEPDGPVRIGVLNDQSGQYADLAGQGSIIAARLAVEDAGGHVLGRPIEILTADHQNKPDVGSAIARKWYDDDNVQAIVDVPVSSVGLAVQQIAKEKNRIALFSGSTSSEILSRTCAPTTFQWTFNTVSAARSTSSAVLKDGGKTWFFIAADYAFGQAMVRDASAVITQGGGKVLGVARHPLGISDFASYILEAQASGADVVAMVSGGGDLTNLIKQAGEFGLASAGQKIVSMQTYISDVHSLGLDKAAGLLLTASFYWDLDDKTRAWSQRFAALDHGRMPTMVQAGVYSAVRHYLKAVAAAGSVDGQKVAATMRSMPVDDFMTESAPIRADGWVMRKMYLFKVKSPAASKGPWDYYDLVSTVNDNDAAPPEVNPCK